ncbi:DUF3631 domain-containing protein [Brucella pecoris]|uniref:DNA primase/helicase n=1 Tax=Brucella pecoris TaxID=867683 RepID=A0A5C5CMP2_9HYPH|nr:DUF3631 domain-containing protein [Brucella pecoris]MBB4093969.1 putative DNA primase/helicase [Brucella pecoris]TNV12663.1 DUF3631 domain-containing protein [Brucella pecoris]
MNSHAKPDDISLEAQEFPFSQSQAEAKIAELSKLSELEYEQCREEVAKALCLRVSKLDEFVSALRPKAPEEEGGEPFEDMDPWADPVEGAELLSEIQATILRFSVLPEHSAPLMAVWALHAWSHDTADISPVLAFVSPEKRCGKTTALSVMSALVPKAMHAVNISTSVLFRVIEKYRPTVLIDEADTFLEANDELRGVLNGGHNRLSAYVWRSVGDDHEPRQFRVWAPKCIAMIGKLPDTLEDRALVVHLRRKQEGEKVERFRADRINEFRHLRQKAARWAADHEQTLRDSDPSVPDELNDRAQDNSRAICAIADAAGGDWPKAIRAALVGSASQSDEDSQSIGVILLRDIAEIFESKRVDHIGSVELQEALCAMEESPWSEWRRGQGISTQGIAKKLKEYGVKPRRDRTQRFYAQSDFADAFTRYLSDGPEITVTGVTTVTHTANHMKENNNLCDGYNGGDGCNRHAQTLNPLFDGEL